jgi:protein required for attachment to host cells
VAHGSAGKLLKIGANGKQIEVLKSFEHIETTQKASEIYSDGLGRSFESSNPSRHALAAPTELHDRERQIFARELVNYLKEKHAQNDFKKLIIVASPEILGDIKKNLSPVLVKSLTHQLNKDLLSQGYSNAELVSKVRDDLNIVCF